MANTFKVNVYEIGGLPRTAQMTVFPTTGFIAQPYVGGNSSLYGELMIVASGQVYGVVETPSALQALAG